MKKYIFICLFAWMGQANALVVNDFTGVYDVSNWSMSLDGGVIDTSGAPASIVEVSSNAGGGFSSTDFTIAAAGNGMVTFDWLYSTTDVDGSSFDPFGWLLNGTFTQVTTNGSFAVQSGTESFAVMVGDIFGFSAQATDSVLGSATTVISAFSAPVPEPSILALFGLGLVAFGFARRKSA